MKLLHLLDTLDQWIEEIPPLNTPQRFGNLAFRTWGARLEEVSELRLSKPIADSSRDVTLSLKNYWENSTNHWLDSPSHT